MTRSLRCGAWPGAITQATQEPLAGHTSQHVGKQIIFDSEIQEARRSRQRGVGVHSGNHHVPGESRLDRDSRCFRVTDFPDHDDVGVLPEDGTQTRRKGEPDFTADPDLNDPWQV
jgi:hypothetical protein